uniref:Uncharacterized protein n=2 Tax=Oryza sativa subsp. japonica TaxID=39947 RepID=Q69QW9_ORYSJ|nr:hypothetical protein [Oryza sativa Japonica Group]BAD31807.1 hypothetical protein [Oryza sativa Japonica Group]
MRPFFATGWARPPATRCSTAAGTGGGRCKGKRERRWGLTGRYGGRRRLVAGSSGWHGNGGPAVFHEREPADGGRKDLGNKEERGVAELPTRAAVPGKATAQVGVNRGGAGGGNRAGVELALEAVRLAVVEAQCGGDGSGGKWWLEAGKKEWRPGWITAMPTAAAAQLGGG